MSVGVTMEAQVKEGGLENLKKLLANIFPDRWPPKIFGLYSLEAQQC